MSSIDGDDNSSGELLYNLYRLVSGVGEKTMDDVPDYQEQEIIIPETPQVNSNAE